MLMKKFLSFALLAMFLLGCDSPNGYYSSGGDGGGSKKSYVVTGDATDLTHNSVTLSGEVKVEIADYESIEWGMMYSTDKDELEARNGERVFGTDDLIENMYSVFVNGLDAETKYYYCALVYLNNKQYKFGSIKNFTTSEKLADSGILNGYEWIDLGLSVKWATCNVGATKPEEHGDYFAWGEVVPKEDYSWSTYKWCNGNYDELTKYCSNSDFGYNGFTDDKTTLDLSDDAANYNWGGSWRMPTTEEQQELINNCTWEWTIQNGVNGYKATGTNGNSIFLPAAGSHNYTVLYDADSLGYYRSSSLATDSPNYAYALDFSSSYVDWNFNNRFCGRSVRPVCP